MTCFTNGEVALIIFGSIAGTIIVSTAVGLFLWWYFKSRNQGKMSNVRFDKVAPVQELHVYENPEFRDENGQSNYDKLEQGQTMLSPESHGNLTNTEVNKKRRSLFEKLRPKKSLSTSDYGQSSESLQSVQELISVKLKSHDFTGLGFTIHGNMRDGIFVKEVLKRGPAFESGNVKTGDRLVNVTISFDKMVFEDALTILSYASPYLVTVELQRGEIQKKKSEYQELPAHVYGSDRRPRYHPLFRSQSVADLSNPSLTAEREEANNVYRSLSVASQPAQNGPSKPLKPLDSILETRESPSPKVQKVITVAQISPPLKDDPPSPKPVPAVLPRQKDPKPPEPVDPYADLTYEEKMEVMRLSYEDPSISQSTPNIFAATGVQILDEIDLSDTEEEPSKVHVKLAKAAPVEESDADSLPDIESAKKELERNQEALERPKTPPPPPISLTDSNSSISKIDSPPEISQNDSGSSVKFEHWETIQRNGTPPQPEVTSPTAVIHPEPQRAIQVPPKAPKPLPTPPPPAVDNDVKPPLLYREHRANLQPVMGQSNWLRPVETREGDDKTKHNLDNSQTEVVDKEQYEKLLYFQQQLTRQQEELARMGIQVPINVQIKTENGKI